MGPPRTAIKEYGVTYYTHTCTLQMASVTRVIGAAHVPTRLAVTHKHATFTHLITASSTQVLHFFLIHFLFMFHQWWYARLRHRAATEAVMVESTTTLKAIIHSMCFSSYMLYRGVFCWEWTPS